MSPGCMAARPAGSEEVGDWRGEHENCFIYAEKKLLSKAEKSLRYIFKAAINEIRSNFFFQC